MLAEIGGAHDIEMWRAWYESQPRGEDRADHHTALIVSEFVNMAVAFAGGSYVSLEKIKDYLRKGWTPDTTPPADKLKRKAKKKEETRKRVRKSLDRIRQGFASVDAERKKKKGK